MDEQYEYVLGFLTLAGALDGAAGVPEENEWAVTVFDHNNTPHDFALQFTANGLFVWNARTDRTYYFDDASLKGVMDNDDTDGVPHTDHLDYPGSTG